MLLKNKSSQCFSTNQNFQLFLFTFPDKQNFETQYSFENQFTFILIEAGSRVKNHRIELPTFAATGSIQCKHNKEELLDSAPARSRPTNILSSPTATTSMQCHFI